MTATDLQQPWDATLRAALDRRDQNDSTPLSLLVARIASSGPRTRERAIIADHLAFAQWRAETEARVVQVHRRTDAGSADPRPCGGHLYSAGVVERPPRARLRWVARGDDPDRAGSRRAAVRRGHLHRGGGVMAVVLTLHRGRRTDPHPLGDISHLAHRTSRGRARSLRAARSSVAGSQTASGDQVTSQTVSAWASMMRCSRSGRVSRPTTSGRTRCYVIRPRGGAAAPAGAACSRAPGSAAPWAGHRRPRQRPAAGRLCRGAE
jgi:hypothetical protein